MNRAQLTLKARETNGSEIKSEIHYCIFISFLRRRLLANSPERLFNRVY